MVADFAALQSQAAAAVGRPSTEVSVPGIRRRIPLKRVARHVADVRFRGIHFLRVVGNTTFLLFVGDKTPYDSTATWMVCFHQRISHGPRPWDSRSVSGVRSRRTKKR